MTETGTGSEIARLRQQIALEYEAAQRGFSGLSYGMARHDFIIARMERMAAHHETLERLVGAQEAIQILAHVLSTSGNEGSGL